jgi:hypothetical protein
VVNGFGASDTPEINGALASDTEAELKLGSNLPSADISTQNGGAASASGAASFEQSTELLLEQTEITETSTTAEEIDSVADRSVTSLEIEMEEVRPCCRGGRALLNFPLEHCNSSRQL